MVGTRENRYTGDRQNNNEQVSWLKHPLRFGSTVSILGSDILRWLQIGTRVPLTLRHP